MSNSDIPENNSTEDNEIESPVDEPAPDWMKFATSGGEPSLTEENTPDWLKDIRSGKGAGAASKQESEEAEGDEPEGGMSDLERLLAEEGIDLGTVGEERPEGSEGMSTRDWLISTSDDDLIRKKLDTDETVEAPPEPMPVAESAPSPQEAEGDVDPYAEMSDLERMLAEEGVDLDAVEEERPEGSEGMSARDWLISTSDDDLIRKKLDTEEAVDAAPAPQQAKPVEPTPAPEPVSTLSDEESAASGDLPDWLSEEESGLTTEPDIEAAPIDTVDDDDDDKMVVEDDLPDWLQDVDDDTGPAPQPVSADVEPMMAVEDDLPDWLDEEEDSTPPLTPEAAPDFEAVVGTVEDDDDKMVVEDDLPDWLQDVDDDAGPAPQPVVADADEMPVVEDDLPDWLSEEESGSTTEPDVEATPPAAPIDTVDDDDDDKMVVEDDLPDWLQDTDDAAGPTPQPIASEADVTMPVEDDLPDWLSASDDEEIEEIEPSEQEMPDWLMEVEEDETGGQEPVLPPVEMAAPVAAVADEERAGDVDDEELPDWLREIQDDSDVEAPSASADVDLAEPMPADTAEADEDLPVWLQEVQADEGEHPLLDDTLSVDDVVLDEDVPDWLSEAQQADEPFEPSEPSPEDLEDYVEEDLPDWLQEAAEEADIVEKEPEVEDVAPAPSQPIDAVDADEAPADDKSLPAWLQDIEDEEIATYGEDVVPIPEPIEEPLTEETVPTPPQPAPVAAEAPSKETAKELPDWLKKLREGEDEVQETPPPVVQVQTAPPAPAPRPVSQPAPPQAAPPAPTPVPVVKDFGDLPQDADERLQIAQAARDNGDIDKAVHAYSSLIASGVYLDKIIEDMQQAIKAYPSNYLLYQTMGDAMMRDGRLQSALEAYREAMSKLAG